MRVIIRLVAVATVLLSMGLMAVSAYAARTAPVDPVVVDANGEPVPTDGLDASGLVSNVDSIARAPDEAEEPATPEAARQDPGTTRFAPDRGAGRLTGPGGGSNLSTTVKVWSVPSIRNGLTTTATGDGIPADQLVVMQQVGNAFGLPWQLLAAIARVESNFGSNMATSSAGAIGYGQFMPEQWEIYGAGGDPYDYRDALVAMARYLIVAGAPENIPEAVHAYNHSWEYVELVLSYATKYGYGSAPGGAELIWPAFGPISSYFGSDHPLGIDIDQVATPHADVLAAHSGVVLFAGGDPCCSYGNYVIVGGNDGITTLYGHFDVVTVRQGQTVERGSSLGIVGCTGVCTAPHVHFEVLVDGQRVDPLAYLPGGG